MATLTNAQGDKVTVNLGGFNGDNAVGTVEDASGTPVPNARVAVTNVENNEHGVERTGNDGKFDIDVDGSAGDRVYVHVEWQDANGRWHIVTGVVILAKAAQKSGEFDLAELEALETAAMKIAFEQKDVGLAADAAYHASDVALIKVLNGLGSVDQETQKVVIDTLMSQELLMLLSKIRRNRGQPRNDSDVWSAIEEILRMLAKLYIKALILQGRGLEPLPEPGPPPGPGPVPGPDFS